MGIPQILKKKLRPWSLIAPQSIDLPCHDRMIPQRSATFSYLPFQYPQDLTSWLDLHAIVFLTNGPRVGRRWTEGDFRREFHLDFFPHKEATGGIWLAWHQQELVGTASWNRPMVIGSEKEREPTARLRWLGVHPGWRRRGIATELVRRIERESFEAGCRSCMLETLSSWSDAICFYEQLGYERSAVE